MYLKQLDIIGFKSFADRTRLNFEPGMIAIVGPNGCGKSNVSDAIRWVLGEQRPTAIRCSKLVDVVFNGTDTRKPLGLAEVSITFADCEELLGTEYHEVTVTRRVYRSGEGEYFINKTACRLKDVQRLFMGTGIGTTSYSVMAQGQIDQILSSKPEDRRAVFEEAAGITKFKADRKEALRKIEQTEQNLLREADVLREMKRQIGSLQRQVGKAQKYKTLRDELRGLDIYVSKGKIAAYALALENNARSQEETESAIAAAAAIVNEAEKATQALHADIHAVEERLGALATAAASADGEYRRAHEVIAVNEQRITEYRMFEDRDGREITATKRQLEELAMQTESLQQKTALLEDGLETAGEALEAAEEDFRVSTGKIDELRSALAAERGEGVDCDRRASAIRDEIARLEAAARETIMKRERLASEKSQLEGAAARAKETMLAVEARLEAAKTAEESAEAAREEAELRRSALVEELEDLRANFGAMQRDAAAKRAQLDLLNEADESAESFSSGAQALLDGSLPPPADAIAIGPLADIFDSPGEYRLALEASLRSWLDAVMVPDGDAARKAVAALRAGGAGSARIVAKTLEGRVSRACDSAEGLRLLNLVTVKDGFEDLAESLIGDVYLVDGDGALPPPGARYVTADGTVFGADGTFDVWMPGSAAASPLSRRMMISETAEALEALERKIADGRLTLDTGAERSAALGEELKAAESSLAAARRAAAQAEGEYTSVARDAASVDARLSSVEGELAALGEANAEDDEKRIQLADELEKTVARRDELMDSASLRQEELQRLEMGHSEESRRLTERRIAVAQMEAELQLTSQQAKDTAKRREELLQMIAGREEGIRNYEDSIQRLRDETLELMGSLDELKEKVREVNGQIEEEKIARSDLQAKLYAAEAGVGGKRAELDRAREFKGRLEVAATEATMRLQNVYEHLNGEYGLDAAAVAQEKDPDWPGGVVPPVEELETRVSSLASQIAALGPVNMVAIEECRELEERYEREKAQEADLLAAKEQIRSLISNLNEKSSELFKSTFSQANVNFQKMFTKLFNGGEARLVLLENAEDPLECGIDIIARPPGKRPQSVTLLSGGERTMTAVALLFAIFMIKPAPFCMLDELDAALDDANIGRFVDALKEFLDRSQFLIITHNQHTIAGSDLVYGVSQQEKGVSRIISMRLTDIGVKPVPDDREGGKVP